MRLAELTPETWPAFERLFATNKTVGGCWCVWFMRDNAEVRAGWGEDNREHLRSRLGTPLGLLALASEPPASEPPVGEARVGGTRVGEPLVGEPRVGDARVGEPLVGERPVGWVAVAPHPTYPRLTRSTITRSGAGPDTWAVTCFFIHPTARRRGLAATLLAAAVDFAVERGAAAVEGYPVDTEGERRGSGDLYHGTLAMFESAGFTLVERRGTRRALVRKEFR